MNDTPSLGTPARVVLGVDKRTAVPHHALDVVIGIDNTEVTVVDVAAESGAAGSLLPACTCHHTPSAGAAPSDVSGAPSPAFDYDSGVGTRIVLDRIGTEVSITVNGRTVWVDESVARRAGTALIDLADAAHREGW